MRATLYFSRNPNPRLAVASARHLKAPVDFEWAAPLAPDSQERFRKINPNLRLPILLEDGESLWETDAIVCRLSQLVGSEFWRSGREMPDMIRWISWAKGHFGLACDMVHFERGTKLRYKLGDLDETQIEKGLQLFHESAALLSAHLRGREWLVGGSPSYADFRMAAFLPYNDVAKLPLSNYPEIENWYGRVARLEGWLQPFEGLVAPELPPVPA
jgi:glutathione S-transferase